MSSLTPLSQPSARPQHPTPPLTIITLPLVMGIFVANALSGLWVGSPMVCLSLATVLLGFVLWPIKSSRHGSAWARHAIGMASFFIGAALFQHHLATIPPDIDAPRPATHTLLIDKTPKETDRSWLVDGRLTSGPYAGRRVRVRLVKASFATAINPAKFSAKPLRPGDKLAFMPPSNRHSLWAIPASLTMPRSCAKTIYREVPSASASNGDYSPTA